MTTCQMMLMGSAGGVGGVPEPPAKPIRDDGKRQRPGAPRPPVSDRVRIVGYPGGWYSVIQREE